MGSKYLPSVKDQKAAERFRRRLNPGPIPIRTKPTGGASGSARGGTKGGARAGAGEGAKDGPGDGAREG